MVKRIRRYEKMLKKRGGFYKLPKTAQAGIYAYVRTMPIKRKRARRR